MVVIYSMFLVTLYFAVGLVNISPMRVADVREFQRVEAAPGAQLCALNEPTDSLFLNSVLDCALECQRSSYCDNFNYHKINKTCDIFFERPTCYGPSPGCIHHQVKILKSSIYYRLYKIYLCDIYI